MGNDFKDLCKRIQNELKKEQVRKECNYPETVSTAAETIKHYRAMSDYKDAR